MKCKNCDTQINDEPIICSHCKEPMHKDCQQYCVMCGEAICDTCSPKHKRKCVECEQIAIHKMEFISSTMFEAFEKCPFLFKELFILNKNTEVPNKYSITGQLLHDLFDRWSQVDVKDPIIMQYEYKEMFDKIDKILFDSDEDKLVFLRKGLLTIENWVEDEKQYPKPLYTEKVHFVKLHDKLPPIRATIDRINGELTDVANWEVQDYKTGKVYDAKHLRTNMQLPIYAMVIKEEYGALPKALRLRFPQHGKDRIFERITDDLYVCDVPRGGTYTISLSETLNNMVDIYQHIQQDSFKPNITDTHFCENFCPLFGNKCQTLSTKWALVQKRGY